MTAKLRATDESISTAGGLLVSVGKRGSLQVELKMPVFVASCGPREQLPHLFCAGAQNLGSVAPCDGRSLERCTNQQKHPGREALQRLELEGAHIRRMHRVAQRLSEPARRYIGPGVQCL